MKITALNPFRCIAMLTGLVLLTLNSCKKDANASPLNTEITPNNLLKTVDFKQQNLSSLTSYNTSAVINYTGLHDITISGIAIKGGTVPSISLSNCYNVHITQCSLGNSTQVGIQLYNCYNITIDYTFITNCSTGIYVINTTKGGIVIQNNQFLNMRGPYPRGQAVQFNTVSGAGNSISNNTIENITGQSNTYEAINCYKCNGTAASPIMINGNWIRGGGPNSSSGGIQLGDNGGSHITASNNILVNPGQMGLSVSGGDNMVFTNNSVYSTQQSFTNVGIVVWAQAGAIITNCQVSNNKVNFINSTGAQNSDWIGPNTPTPSGWSTNVWAASIDATLLPASITSPTAATVPLSQPATPGSGPTLTTSAPINITGQSNITIASLSITGGSSPCIHLTNCSNVFINLCNLINSTSVAVLLDNCSNVTIQQNTISNVEAGVVANNCTGGIKVLTNQMKNMVGPNYKGAFVQFNSVSGANNIINSNKLENITGQNNAIDAIDIVTSNGTSASPITISTNQIEGSGTSTLGGGIQLGHNGGTYQIATGNILINPGQFGMDIIGGDNISITNNSVFAAASSITNVGIYIQSQPGYPITNSTVSGNLVNWTNSKGVQNSDWLAPGDTTPSGWSTNSWAASITASLLPSPLF